MRCRRCQFENMPGETACFRCGTPLAPTAPDELTPPRAGWTKPLRRARYWLNRNLGLGLRAEKPAQKQVSPGAGKFLPPFLWTIGKRDLFAAGVSMVPGLGHLMNREARRIRLVWPAWLAAMWIGLVFYGAPPGALFIGAAAALHAWMVCDAGGIRDPFAERRLRLLAVLAVFGLLLFGIYSGVRHGAGALVRGVRAPMDLAADDIRAGDFLLVATRAFRDDAPRRGDIILYCTLAELRGPGYAVNRGETVGQILALPGERVLFKGGKILVCRNADVLEVLRAPAEFASLELELDVPPGQYFCLPPEVNAALGPEGNAVTGAAATAAYIRMMGFASASDLRGRAFMLYQPIWRRKSLLRGPASS